MNMSVKQRDYWLVLVMLLSMEFISYFVLLNPTVELLVTIMIILIFFSLAFFRPTWLCYISIAELVIGSKGYLFQLTIGSTAISWRMMMFAILLLVALIKIVKKRNFKIFGNFPRALIWLFAWLCVAGLWGLIRGNSSANVYFDVNAFLYLLIFIPWLVILPTDPNWRSRALTILLAGATIVGLESWLMLLLFGQDLSVLPTIYHWIRNTGVGEITLINGHLYRIFLQSQIYCLLIFGLTLVVWIRGQAASWWWWPMMFSGLGVIISLSRSYWLGLGAISIWCLYILLRPHTAKAWRRLSVVIPVGLLIWILISWAVNWPSPWPIHGRGGNANVIIARLHTSGAADASTARQNQFHPLIQAIIRHPVIGSGFGTTVTYYSTDPRVRGWRTTAAFELGYLDLWLKIGLIGLGLYAWWVINTMRLISRNNLSVYFLAGMIALLVVNLTSPYLNHPLGLGWILLASIYARGNS